MRVITVAGLNTGVLNTASDALPIEDLADLVVLVAQASGTITGAILTIEQSLDGITWYTTGITISGAALSANVTICARYMRLRVSTQSGAASTATCTIHGKPGHLPYLEAATLKLSTGMVTALAAITNIQGRLRALESLGVRAEQHSRRGA